MSFYQKYITLNLNEYEAFGGADFYVTLFLAVIALCLCVGFFIFAYRKNTMIMVIEQLYRHGAVEEPRAKTLSELGIKNTRIVRELLSSGRLSRAVSRVGAKTLTYEEYVEMERARKKERKTKRIADRAESSEPPFDSYRFYISKECDIAAKGIISKPKTSVLQCILLSVFVISVSVCIMFIMPKLLEALSSFLTK